MEVMDSTGDFSSVMFLVARPDSSRIPLVLDLVYHGCKKSIKILIEVVSTAQESHPEVLREE